MSDHPPPENEEHDLGFEIADVLGGVSEVVSTSYGPITVTVIGDRTKSPCIAYPDAGLTHRTCFQSLLVACGPQSLLLKNFCMYLFDLPGCESPDATIPALLQPVSLDKLAAQLAEAVTTLKLRECLGVGVGTGGYVLSKCAVDNAKLFAGLVLISPACKAAGWWEWAAGKTTVANLRFRGWTSSATHHFAARAFSPATLQLLGGDSDLLKSFKRELASVSPASAAAYLTAAIGRASIVTLVPRLRCRLLLLFGSESIYYGDSMDLAAAADKSRFALVEETHAGTLLTQERPAALLSPLTLFLTALQMEGFGLGLGAMIGE